MMMNLETCSDVAGIRTLFRDYVESTGSTSRHTKEASIAAGNFEAFLHGAANANPALTPRFVERTYDRMMDCAVEFEESGFIAGFRYALSLVKAGPTEFPPKEPNYPGKSQPTPHDPTPGSYGVPTASTPPEVQMQPIEDSVSANQDGGKDETAHFITTWDIAEMFETTNAKVVKRIDNELLPYMDEERRSYFVMDIRRILTSNRKYKYYRLNRVACEEYLKVMEPRKKYVNIAAGITKLRLMISQVFPVKEKSS